MLRINLLPIRQLKKRAKARNQILGTTMGVACIVLICGLLTFLQAGKISAIEASIEDLKREKKSFAPQLAQIAEIKKTKKELERKTDVIDKLKADSSLTVRVLDEVANRVDNNRMWLNSLNQQGGSLSLTGVALDNETVAQFMDNLKLSPFVRSVDLTSSSQKVVSGRYLKSFSLRCAVAQPISDKEDTGTSK